ncbi:MAG: FAD-dependent oxidoreductase [Patescibacteria group bacterium]|mgnify:CR=1 FL=1
MKKIVILGAGFGGLRTAIILSKKLRRLDIREKYEIVLVDRNDHHTYTPLLYEVATTSKETADLPTLHEVAAYKIDTILKHYPIRFTQGEITAIDLIEGDLFLNKKHKITCDYVVLALGSEANFFDIPGVRGNALSFKTFSDAIRIRNAVWNLALEGKNVIKILIGGGGPTGVELAGELKMWCGELEETFKKCRLNVTIIEAQPTILSSFGPKIISVAEKRLQKLAVKIIAPERIATAKKGSVVLQSGREVPYDVLVWTGGVKAPDILSRLPIQEELRNHVKVIGGMECLPQTSNLKLHARIYAIGDNVCFYDPITKKAIPGVARAALSQATIAAHNILEDILFEEKKVPRVRHTTYNPMDYPYIIPVGGKYAIAKIGPFVVSGFLGWILKGIVELNYLVSIMPFSQAIKTWLKGLKIFIKNDRLG